jgi:hypothetical protein
MEKRDTGGNFSKEEIFFLSQLIKSLEESELKLEEYYNKKNYENFNNLKKLMISVSKKISEVIK